MSESTQAILQRAYELIEMDELEQARAMLTPLLETDADNPALWWVYAHALRERSLGQMALDRVIALDAEYPGAAELKADLDALEAQDDSLRGEGADAEPVALSATDAEIDDWEDLQSSLPIETESASGRRAFVALLVILLVVATGAALVASGIVDLSGLLGGILNTSEPPVVVVTTATAEPSATQVGTAGATLPASTASATELPGSPREPTDAADGTDIPDDIGPAPPATQATDSPGDAGPAPAITVPGDAPIDQSPTPESTSTSDSAERVAAGSGVTTDYAVDDQSESQAVLVAPSPTPAIPLSTLETYVHLVENGLTDIRIDRSLVLTRATELGHTLVLQACAVPGSEFTERLRIIMEAVVAVFPEIPFGIDAVAVGLHNCDDPSAQLRIIGATKAVIQQYANKEIDAKAFQRAWQPLS